MTELYLTLKPKPTKCTEFCSACHLYAQTPFRASATESDMFYISTNPNRPPECNALEWNGELPDFNVLKDKITQIQKTCTDCFNQKNGYKSLSMRMILHLYSCADDNVFYPKSLVPLSRCEKYKWILLRPIDNNYEPENITRLIFEARGVPTR